MAVPAPSNGASITAPLPSPTIPAAPAIAVRAASALTTPYVFPPECTNVFSLTTGTGRVWTHADVTETFLYVNKDDPTYLSCRPPGFSEPIGSGRVFGGYNVYSGAVCPSGWVAHQVGTTSFWTDRSKTLVRWSTAHCCSGEDSLVSDVWELAYETAFNVGAWACASQVPHSQHLRFPDAELERSLSFVEKGSVTVAISLSTYAETDVDYASDVPISTYTATRVRTVADATMTTTTAVFKYGRAFYAPWIMEWVEDDNKTLNPSWPTLTNDMLIPTWQPGSSLSRPGEYENRGLGAYPAEPSIPVKVAIPIIAILGALVLIAASFPLWRFLRKCVMERKEKKERKLKSGEQTQEWFEMEELTLDSEMGRDGLGRSDMGSEVNLNSVTNTLPVEGDQEELNMVRRR